MSLLLNDVTHRYMTLIKISNLIMFGIRDIRNQRTDQRESAGADRTGIPWLGPVLPPVTYRGLQSDITAFGFWSFSINGFRMSGGVDHML